MAATCLSRTLHPMRRDLLQRVALAAFLAAPVSVWSDSPRVVEIALADGRASGSALIASARRTPVVRLRQGEAVELRWSSDRDATLHLHGYEIEIHAALDRGGIMSFVAHAAGRFPVETHDAQDRHRVVLYVEVLPR